MVADTNPTPAALGSDPKGFQRVGDQVYFTATKPETGTELFALDAHAAGARLVADIAPNGASSQARLLGQAGGRLILSADLRPFYWDPYSTQFQIVALDPVTGVHEPLTQLAAQWAGNDGRFAPIAEFAGLVVIRDNSDDSIWASDGTRAGTRRLYGPGGPNAQPFCAMNDRLVFTVRRQNATELWISDGTPGGSGIIAQLPASLGEVRAVSRGDGCYLLLQNTDNSGFNVWLTDGTMGGTGIVKTLASAGIAELYLVGQTPLVFLKSGPVSKLVRLDTDTPLWSGTAWYENDGVVSNGVLLLSLSTSAGERALITDGTQAGTRSVNYQGGVFMPWFRPRWHASENGYVIVNDVVSYRVDLATAQAYWMSGVPSLFWTQVNTVAFGGAVVGIGQDSSSGPSNIGTEVWRSDGTLAGTYPLADVAVATADGAYLPHSSATTPAGVLIYSAYEDTPSGPLRRGLWRTDGTPTGTRALSRNLYGADSVSLVRRYGEGAIFLLERNTAALWDLRRVDADFTSAQSVWTQTTRIDSLETTDAAAFFPCHPQFWSEPKVCAFRPEDVHAQVVHSLAPFGSYRFLGSLGDIALFFADYTLWRSDGTPTGTTQISSTLRSTTSGGSERLGNRLLFGQCDDGGQNCGLYATDGTAAGSGLVRTIDGAIRHMAPLGDGIVFVTDPGNQLWVSDGTAAGTRSVVNLQAPLHSMTSTGRHLHMVREAIGSVDYMVSDGTAAGTFVVPMPPGLLTTLGAQPTVVDRDNVLFRCSYGVFQHEELCSVGGDGFGVQLVGDFYEGPQSSQPLLIGRAGGSVYYAINDGRHGVEPWRFVGDLIFADTFQR